MKDVFDSTKNWSLLTEEVHLVKEIDGEWLTIFRNQHSIMIGELKQNWLGIWKLQDERGKESSLASIYFPPGKEDEITWSGSEVEEQEVGYYFGQIINPKIQKIDVETKQDFYEEVPIITTNGKRFFFKKVKGKLVLPVNIRGLSETGAVVYSTLPENP